MTRLEATSVAAVLLVSTVALGGCRKSANEEIPEEVAADTTVVTSASVPAPAIPPDTTAAAPVPWPGPLTPVPDESVLYRPPPGTAPGPEAVEWVDEALRAMRVGRVAFSTPVRMPLDSTATVRASIGLAMAAETLLARVGPGARATGWLRISQRMKAKLVGPDFDIAPITDTTQAISGTEPTDWSWDIHPKHAGTALPLHLSFTAILRLPSGSETTREIRTFDRVITVTVTEFPPGRRVLGFLSRNWQYLLSAIVIPFVLAAWSRWRKRKEREPVATPGGAVAPRRPGRQLRPPQPH
jgi:hypothetical protein